jgi:hypothetical protein
MAIAAGVAAYPTIGPQSIPKCHRVFKFSVAGPLDSERLGHRDSKHAYKSYVQLHIRFIMRSRGLCRVASVSACLSGHFSLIAAHKIS